MRSLAARVVALCLILPASPAFAFGEVFKVETSGTEYCGDFASTRFNARTNVDLWGYVASESEIVLSFTPNFAPGTYFSLVGTSYLSGTTRAAFVGGQLFEDAFATIQGTATFDKQGIIRSLSGIFVQSGIVHRGCFSSGSFKTAPPAGR